MEDLNLDLPEGFPMDSSEKELRDVIRSLHNRVMLKERPQDIPANLGPVISVAQSELQTRSSDKLAKSANFLALVGLLLGILIPLAELGFGRFIGL